LTYQFCFTRARLHISTIKHLAEDVIVEIVNDRFMLPDYSRGIVIDGFETLFYPNLLSAATTILKAFNNPRYIYCFTLKSDFNKYKEHLSKNMEKKVRRLALGLSKKQLENHSRVV
jgi:hypothetical protein